jgi:fatty acid desaturase
MHHDRELFLEIKKSAVEAGLMRPTPVRYLLLALACTALFAGGYAGLYFADGLWRVAAILATAYGVVQFAFLGHDAGHYEASRRPYVNDCLGQIGMTIVSGLSFSYWRQQHNLHHKFSQDETQDPDMQSNAVALYAGALASRRGIGKLTVRWQAPLLIGMYALHIFQLRYDGWVYVRRNLSRAALDAALVALHFIIWLVVPSIFLGPTAACLNYLIVSMLAGMIYGPVFVTNHVGAESFKPNDGVSYWRRQISGSRNVTCWPFFDFHFGGLNFQIEHHLFPGMSRYHYRKLSPIVRRICEREGLSYLQESFPRAMWSVLAHLHRLSRLFRATQAEAEKNRRNASVVADPVHLESSASTGRQPVGVLSSDSRSVQRCM